MAEDVRLSFDRGTIVLTGPGEESLPDVREGVVVYKSALTLGPVLDTLRRTRPVDRASEGSV